MAVLEAVVEDEVLEDEVDVVDDDEGVVEVDDELDDDELEVELDDELEVDELVVVVELEPVSVVVPVLVVPTALLVVELVDVLVVGAHDPLLPAAAVTVSVQASANASGDVAAAIVPSPTPMIPKKRSSFALVRNSQPCPVRGQTVQPRVHRVTALERKDQHLRGATSVTPSSAVETL